MTDEKLWRRIDPLASLPLPRRTFLQIAGFTAASLSLASCRSPEQQIVPQLAQPAEMTPGRASWYASTCRGCSAGCGVLVKVREGRPIKLEGNPEHPISRGGLCSVAHAMIFDLFDAARLAAPTVAGARSDWTTVDRQVLAKLDEVRRSGRSVRVVTGSDAGPTLTRAIDGLLATFTDGRHVVYDAVPSTAIASAYESTHGAALTPGYSFDRARVIVSFDADFLGTWISPVEFTRQYSEARDVAARRDAMSRHIQIESRMSLSGANADRRVVAHPDEIDAMLRTLAAAIARRAGVVSDAPPTALAERLRREAARIEAELWSHRGRSLVVSGSNAPTAQRLVATLNALLGNDGATVELTAASHQRRERGGEMAALIDEIEAGRVGALIVSGVNPAYDHPLAGGFNRALATIPLTIALNPRSDETSARCRFVCPDHHFLERWDDMAPREGVASPVQPALAPLFATRSAIESLLRWTRDGRSAYEAVRDTWREVYFPRQTAHADFEEFWFATLHDGRFAWTPEGAAPALDPGSVATTLAGDPPATDAGARLVAVLYEKPSLRDGAHANNPWLQELPDPISRISWDNYACVAPELARRRSLSEGDVVVVAHGDRRIELPVHVQPGQHPDVVAIAVGYGRTNAGATGIVGANAFALVADGPHRAMRSDGVTIAPTGRTATLASVQPHDGSEGRDLVRTTTLAGALAASEGADARGHDGETLWHGPEYAGQKWGMSVDLNACTGCGACVVSCQAENNIPVVGREEVANHREMYWLRVDRYIDGDESNPRVGFQPLMCGQCDNATCENVCPVLATVHSSDGLNMQVYNRCVGTRYCANNCALKARRFNWFEYEHGDELANLALNPDVTVRTRGVMEKCTFCVQRIQEGKINARNEGRAVADGEILTACQQSCPARAISFGDLNDPRSAVVARMREPRAYEILEEVNLGSAVSYLARVAESEEA